MADWLDAEIRKKVDERRAQDEEVRARGALLQRENQILEAGADAYWQSLRAQVTSGVEEINRTLGGAQDEVQLGDITEDRMTVGARRHPNHAFTLERRCRRIFIGLTQRIQEFPLEVRGDQISLAGPRYGPSGSPSDVAQYVIKRILADL